MPSRDLIVLESPNKVRDVHKYAERLGLQAKVVATCGHMLDLPPMSDGACVDTSTFSATRLEPRDAAAGERITWLRAAIGQADRVIVATDPDREGEAIAAQVWQWIPPGQAWRATFQEITAAGVERGIGDMRSHLDDNAVEASRARRIVDRLAGWHATSLVFEKLRHHKGISAGRLQSAALRLVVDRYREHQAFKASSTFGIRLHLRTTGGAEFTARVLADDGAALSFLERRTAEARAVPGRLVVQALDAAQKSQRARPPFDATSWLQVAQKALGLSVKDATKAIQALFETGMTTYPRTDTVRVSDEAIVWAREEIARRYGSEWIPEKPWAHKDGGAAVQGAHEAIRPTIPEDVAELRGRTDGQWGDAYRLIEARFLASQAAARVVEETTVLIGGGDISCRARGDVELFAGWKRVLQTDAAEENCGTSETGTPATGDPAVTGADDPTAPLPALSLGEEVEVIRVEIVTQTAKPKPVFTQASLVAELKRLGIGRPSTYQSVIPILLGRGWAREELAALPGKAKKKADLPVLVPNEVGFDLYDFLVEAFPGLVDYKFTAGLEDALDQIEKGKRSRIDVASTWWGRFHQEVVAAKALQPRLPQRKDLGPCPRCASDGRTGRLRLLQGISAKTDRPYEFAACDADTKDARICGHTAPTHDGELQKVLPCPECGTGMRPVNRKDGGHSWVCAKDGWFLANRTWKIIKAPPCPKCGQPMGHRERQNPKGEFFWACFGDRIFVTSDRFGRVVRTDATPRG